MESIHSKYVTTNTFMSTKSTYHNNLLFILFNNTIANGIYHTIVHYKPRQHYLQLKRISKKVYNNLYTYLGGATFINGLVMNRSHLLIEA